GVTIIDPNGTNSGSNTNWIFNPTPLYWVATAAGNWSSPANWSTSSGGVGGAGPPMVTESAVFDGNGTGNSTIDKAVTMSSLTINSGYTGTITTNTASGVTLTNDFTQNAGTLTLGGSSITLQGNWAQVGGTFNAQTSTVVFNGSTGGTINSV